MTEKKPTIDERLEAIAQTLELVANMQLVTEEKLKGLVDTTQRFEEFAKLVLSNHEERLRQQGA